MTLFSEATFGSAMVRVNHRDQNIAFFTQNLGFRLDYEENAIAVFSDYSSKVSKFIIEESPSFRTRAVEGAKKLAKIIVKVANPADIDQLLLRGASYVALYQGEKGYAFESLSPQGDRFLLHAEEDLISLRQVEQGPTGEPSPDFKGLTSFKLTEIELRVPDTALASAFYQEHFAGDLPLTISFVSGQGPDLQAQPEETWDLEILEFYLPKTADLAALREDLEAAGLTVYLDRAQKTLVLSDTSNIELWFSK